MITSHRASEHWVTFVDRSVVRTARRENHSLTYVRSVGKEWVKQMAGIVCHRRLHVVTGVICFEGSKGCPRRSPVPHTVIGFGRECIIKTSPQTPVRNGNQAFQAAMMAASFLECDLALPENGKGPP